LPLAAAAAAHTSAVLACSLWQELLCDPTLADAANDEAKSLGHMPTPSFSAPGTTLNESSEVSSAAAFSQTPTPP
jgi:hypothetical protein